MDSLIPCTETRLDSPPGPVIPTSHCKLCHLGFLTDSILRKQSFYYFEKSTTPVPIRRLRSTATNGGVTTFPVRGCSHGFSVNSLWEKLVFPVFPVQGSPVIIPKASVAPKSHAHHCGWSLSFSPLIPRNFSHNAHSAFSFKEKHQKILHLRSPPFGYNKHCVLTILMSNTVNFFM